jgi:glycosyltransferase involved in cell wall biosynthesis
VPENNMAPEISVIIPFRNARPQLRGLVDALCNQTWAPGTLEVIWIDDGSTDDAEAWLRGELRPGWQLLVHQRPRGAYAARNSGLAAASGRNFAFTDVDCRPHRDWIEQGMAALDTLPRVAGRVQIETSERPSTAELVDAARFFRQSRYVKEGFGATANLFVRREVFERVGGFDDELKSGGDYEFGQRCLRAGFPIGYAEHIVVSHPARGSLRELLKKSERVGFGTGQLVRRGGIPLRSLAARAADRLTLARRRGAKERSTGSDRQRSWTVTGVHLLVHLATMTGSVRGLLLPGAAAVPRGNAPLQTESYEHSNLLPDHRDREPLAGGPGRLAGHAGDAGDPVFAAPAGERGAHRG